MVILNQVNIVGLIVLLLLFLYVSDIADVLHSRLDTLPMRFASVLLILGGLRYDKLLGLGIFLLVSAIYIKHNSDDIKSVIGNSIFKKYEPESKYTNATSQLDHGGNADEALDTMDFVSKTEDQDNEFKNSETTIDEKHAILTAPLGSKSQQLFPDDSKHANAMEHGNKNGSFD